MKLKDNHLMDYVKLYHVPYPTIYGYYISVDEKLKKELNTQINAIQKAQESYDSQKYGKSFVYQQLFRYCSEFLTNLLNGYVLNKEADVNIVKNNAYLITKMKTLFQNFQENSNDIFQLQVNVTKLFKQILSGYVALYRKECKNDSSTLKIFDAFNVINDIIKSLTGQEPTAQKKATDVTPTTKMTKTPTIFS